MTAQPQPSPVRSLECRGLRVTLGATPVIVGIVNVTPDSFYDGGRHATTDAAVAQANNG